MPDGPAYFGTTPIHGMKAVSVHGPARRALLEYVYSLSEPPDADAADPE